MPGNRCNGSQIHQTISGAERIPFRTVCRTNGHTALSPCDVRLDVWSLSRRDYSASEARSLDGCNFHVSNLIRNTNVFSALHLHAPPLQNFRTVSPCLPLGKVWTCSPSHHPILEECRRDGTAAGWRRDGGRRSGAGREECCTLCRFARTGGRSPHGRNSFLDAPSPRAEYPSIGKHPARSDSLSQGHATAGSSRLNSSEAVYKLRKLCLRVTMAKSRPCCLLRRFQGRVSLRS